MDTYQLYKVALQEIGEIIIVEESLSNLMWYLYDKIMWQVVIFITKKVLKQINNQE